MKIERLIGITVTSLYFVFVLVILDFIFKPNSILQRIAIVIFTCMITYFSGKGLIQIGGKYK